MTLSKEEATKFFADYYGGEHHIPGYAPKQFGLGWSVIDDRGDLATYDFSQLTRLVVLAHDRCIRVGIMPKGTRKLEISIHKRQRDGSMYERHPTLEQAIETIRNHFKEE